MISFLSEFLQDIPFWSWWAFAIGLLAIEMIAPSTLFLWPAASAFFVGLAVMTPPFGDWRMQLGLFAILTVAFAIFGPKYLSKLEKVNDNPQLNRRADQFIGERALVSTPFEAGRGKVKLGDTVWLATSDDGSDFVEGDAVIVSKAESTMLTVGRKPD